LKNEGLINDDDIDDNTNDNNNNTNDSNNPNNIGSNNKIIKNNSNNKTIHPGSIQEQYKMMETKTDELNELYKFLNDKLSKQ